VTADYVKKVCGALRAGHQYSGIVDKVDTAAADLIEALYLANLATPIASERVCDQESGEKLALIEFVASQRQRDIDPELRDQIINKISALATPPAEVAVAWREPTEDQVMDAIRKMKLTDRKVLMIVAKWKVGIDIDEPSFEAMQFAHRIAALYASPPPPVSGEVKSDGPEDDWEERGAADALRKATIEECAQAAEDAKLPPEYQWGHDAMEQFNFGKRRAAEAIRAPASGEKQ
jgi:hypothetical protein